MMYDHFAAVYDSLMDQVPYEAWCGYIGKTLEDFGIRDGLVLDLGCGTGSAARILSGMGYDMIGVDGSEEMLMAAREKMSPAESERILLLNQDMREFELYGTVRAVVSMCDTLNYCESTQDLLQVFRLVNNYLDPGGLFLFDLNTAYKYREVLGDNVFASSQEDCAYIWENAWFEQEKVNQYDLTLFIRDEDGHEGTDPGSHPGGRAGRGIFLRHQELHIQRAFSDTEVKELLALAGLELIRSVDAYTDEAPAAETERILYIARECMKTSGKTEEKESQKSEKI